MMRYENAFAKMFKERDNKTSIGAVIGTVLSVEPLKIGILNNEVMLDKTNCHLCSGLVQNYKRNMMMEIKAYTVNASGTDSRGDTINTLNISDKTDYDVVITLKDILKIEDKVLVIADVLGQEFFIIDKVGDVIVG